MSSFFDLEPEWRELSPMELEVSLEALLDSAKSEYLLNDSNDNWVFYQSIRKNYLRWIADKTDENKRITQCYECMGIYFWESEQ